MEPPVVSVVVPTSGRAAYLEVTLSSLKGQRTDVPHELVVIDDGATDGSAGVAERADVRCVSHGTARGLNAARNTGLRETAAPLVAFVDDDVLVPPGWLDALARGAERHPEAEAFGGPIRARLEGPAPRSCGREEPPVTTLDLGPDDREAAVVWGANFAVRRGAVDRVGPFDERLVRAHGDEEEWLERLRAAGGRIVYLAAAGLDHRRVGDDARLRSLARAAYFRGRGARASDLRRDRAPSLAGELRVLAGCGWHTVRRACPQGVIAGSHSAGRIVEALRPEASEAGAPDFLSGDAGDVTNRRRVVKRAAGEVAFDALDALARTRRRTERLAHRQPPLRVLVLAIYRPGSLLAESPGALASDRHEVELALGAAGAAEPALAPHTRVADLAGGKFQNLNLVLATGPQPSDYDWTVVVDDDLRLPHHFLDRFLALCEAFALDLAQPAQTLRSHSAWRVTRRRPAALVRETRFVEIGPVTAFGRRAAAELLPFPDLRFGWGLDLHWAAVAAERGWRLGVVDAVAVEHRHALVGAAYRREDAVAEAAGFLADRPYLPATGASEPLATHRRLPVSRRGAR